VLLPEITVPFGRARVITSVVYASRRIPPKLLAGSGIVTVVLLRGTHALVLDLYAGLIRIPKSMHLKPEKSH
jgi:hypothetical protein